MLATRRTERPLALPVEKQACEPAGARPAVPEPGFRPQALSAARAPSAGERRTSQLQRDQLPATRRRQSPACSQHATGGRQGHGDARPVTPTPASTGAEAGTPCAWLVGETRASHLVSRRDGQASCWSHGSPRAVPRRAPEALGDPPGAAFAPALRRASSPSLRLPEDEEAGGLSLCKSRLISKTSQRISTNKF